MEGNTIIKKEYKNAFTIRIKGLVQGVGFRPFIYHLAKSLNLKGWVENRNDCVQIKIRGSAGKMKQFIVSIKKNAPIASNIESINYEKSYSENFSKFEILKSQNSSENITEISPDIAVCSECLEDIKKQSNRSNYPFINCTNCGPLFSIINDLPYDREKTTMKKFIMCEDCEKEYLNITNRFFHAQPVACTNCGPEYELLYNNKRVKNFDKILEIVSGLIINGNIIAIKGVGGFFLACDAQNEKTVKRLRELKNREGKPFAVMFSNIEKLKEYAEVNKKEELNLVSWRRPILLVKQKKTLAKDVSVGLNTIGAMLPYMPFHFLLFESLKIPAVVLTSGNISEEPIIIDNNEAISRLSKVSDALLLYNREIYNRTDDSIVTVVNNKERIIRRSRGFAPSPINLKFNVDGIIATGAELKNCFCVGKGNQVILSQHIGDLKNIETLDFFSETIDRFKHLFRIKPTLIVNDIHPDYLSTKYAESSGYKRLSVQHHHAHLASCMAENDIDEKVIGVSFDGIGYGDDQNIWGGEFFICDLNKYNRYTHFEYMPMPGGDKASEEPWRMGISYLYNVYGKDFINLELPFLDSFKNDDINLILFGIDNKINNPMTSSAGRLFDAIASIINLCLFPSFEAEAPIRLESIIDEKCKKKYSYKIGRVISVKDTIREIVMDIKAHVPKSVISAKFHNTIISIIVTVTDEIREKYDINKVVLSGGTFQNKYILGETEKVLSNKNYEVFTHSKVPTNDGGIALGQLAIAAKKRQLGLINIE